MKHTRKRGLRENSYYKFWAWMLTLDTIMIIIAIALRQWCPALALGALAIIASYELAQ